MLDLYHLQHCPYSKKVRDFIEQHELKSEVRYHDVAEDSEAFRHLQEMTGHSQVPCLVIDGKPMLESDDIVTWLEDNLLPEGARRQSDSLASQTI